jgi:ornithine carrier protein
MSARERGLTRGGTGIVSKAFEHPLDLVKVRLQSQPLDQPLRFNGPLDCMVQTFKGEGVKGLWRVRLSLSVLPPSAAYARVYRACLCR